MSAAPRTRERPEDSHTGPAIRAYLAHVRPLRGVADVTDDEEYQRGRSLIERLALSAHADDPPTLTLSPAQCADVLAFMTDSEPVDPREYWKTPRVGPDHHFGLFMLLTALKDSLRQCKGRG